MSTNLILNRLNKEGKTLKYHLKDVYRQMLENKENPGDVKDFCRYSTKIKELRKSERDKNLYELNEYDKIVQKIFKEKNIKSN